MFYTIKEASLPMTTSHDALRGHLSSALKVHYGIDPNSWSAESPYVSSVFPSQVVYQYKGGLWRNTYTVQQGASGADPTVSLGKTPKLVHVAYADTQAEAPKEARHFFLEDGMQEGQPVVTVTPDGVQQVRESVAFLQEVSVKEAGVTKIPIKIIGPGWGSMAYYSEAMLKESGPKTFVKGTHMMWNHATETEESDRPEGDLDNLAAVLTKDAYWDPQGIKGPGLYSEAKVFSDYATQVAEKGAHIGVSINAAIKTHEGEVDGRRGRIAEQFVRAFSTDFVTKAGAKGAPIVPVVEAERVPPVTGAIMDTKEQDTLTKENADLKSQLATEQAKTRALESGQNATVAYAMVATVLREADIPFSDRLLKRACESPVMKDGKLDPEWVKSVAADFSEGVSGKVSGVGGGKESDKAPDLKDIEKRMTESLRELGVPEAGLKYAAAGRV